MPLFSKRKEHFEDFNEIYHWDDSNESTQEPIKNSSSLDTPLDDEWVVSIPKIVISEKKELKKNSDKLENENKKVEPKESEIGKDARTQAQSTKKPTKETTPESEIEKLQEFEMPENETKAVQDKKTTKNKKQSKNFSTITNSQQFKVVKIRLTEIKERLSKSVQDFMKKHKIFIDKKRIAFHINESLVVIFFLFLSLIGFIQAIGAYNSIDKLSLIKQHYVLKRDIKIEQEKIKENKKAEYLADILRFWVKTSYGRYPEGWYLEAFKQIFPEKITDIQLLTFIEWWGSEFVEFQWRTVRVDNDLIRTFKKEWRPISNGSLTWYKFKIELEGEANKINNLLYNIRYSNKIPKNFLEIKKTQEVWSSDMNIDTTVIFYFAK